ncbi:hypothetical protein FRC03_011503 [Tulasnella sp. 419]|nr:hypothetical protein FRC03_011503 [Tulasnella sp. 419]
MAPKRKRVVDDEFSLSQEAEDHDDGQQAVIAQLLRKVQEDRQQAQRKAEKELLKKAKVAFDELVEESQTQWDNSSQKMLFSGTGCFVLCAPADLVALK